MQEKSQLKLKTLDNSLTAQTARIMDSSFKAFHTQTAQTARIMDSSFKAFHTQTAQTARIMDSSFKAFHTQTAQTARIMDSSFKAFHTQTAQTARIMDSSFKAFHTQTAQTARIMDSLKTFRVRSVDPFKGLRVQLVDPLTELRVQMVQINKSVINFTRIFGEIAKSTTVLIPTRAVDIDAFIESEHREVVEQPDGIQCPDDRAHSFGKKVFIACGKDKEAKQTIARWIQKLGLEEIIIDEQPSGALTRIEKLEKYTDDVGFTVALLTPDDVGKPKDEFGEPNFRPSQDVIWELVTLICKHGRDRICLLYKGKLELPSYMNGINLVPMDTNDGWILNLIQEMKSAGLLVDMSKVI